ncbi:MAG: AbrB/MazE/SpoVT family DNA-binding domain-containing protein [Candidatus Hydrothermarchaeales archaeon]
MVTVTRKYQVTIPKLVRDDLKLKIGEEVVFIKSKEGYRLMKASEIIEEGAELCKDIGKTIEEMRKGLAKEFK